jgi:RND family efflux transporter MFP subunit
MKTNTMKKISFIIIALLFFISGCKEKVKPGASDIKRQQITGVVVSEAQQSQIDEYYETSGTVRAKNIVNISSRVIGAVTSLRVKEGDRVSAGQVIMTIDDRDAAQRLNASESGYKESLKALESAKQNKSLADVTYRRYKKLHEEKAVSHQEMDQIETRKKIADIEYERAQESVNRAKAGVKEAQVHQGFAKITAPVSGVVTEKKIESGSMAAPGIPMLTIEDTSSFRLEANVDERLSGKIKTGMSVEVMIEAIGQRTSGKISEIVPAVDPMSRTFVIKADIKGAGLRTGLYGKVFIPQGKKEAILIPQKAVIEKGQLTGVYTVDDKGVATYRLVKTGKIYKDRVEILSGLNKGEKMIVDGAEKAVDGGIIKQ